LVAGGRLVRNRVDPLSRLVNIIVIALLSTPSPLARLHAPGTVRSCGVVGGVLILLSVAFVLSTPVVAQTTVSFIIADSLTARPIQGTLVELVTPLGNHIWSGRSGPDGRATTRVSPGKIVVTAQMLAYEPAGPVTITVPDRDSAFVRILLSPAPIAVDSLAVTSRRRTIPNRWERWGFEWRRTNRRFGLFMERADLEKQAVHSLSALLRRLAGVRVVSAQFGNPQVYMRRGQFLDRFGGSTACGPDVYRDGMLLHEGGRNRPAPIDDLVQLNEIAALELYRSGEEVPVEFRPNVVGSCGAIVIWTQ
jgi:hypothetical protein